MAYILITLSVLALLAAAALLISDSREQTQPAPRGGDTPAPEVEPGPGAGPGEEFVPDSPEDPAEIIEPEAEPESEPKPETESEPEFAPESEPDRAPEPDGDEAEEERPPLTFHRWEPEPAPAALEPEPQPATDPTAEQDAAAQAEALTVEGTEPHSEPLPEPAPAPRPHRRSGLQLPGASRRERRAWAERNNFDFVKQDEFLNGEWSRGAAASGAAAKDIASGMMYGHDTFVMDLGGVTVMAMRTGEVSDVVVDLRRAGYQVDSSPDLLEAGEVEGFTVLSTEVGPAQRFLDVRVRTALERMPAAVTSVWCESEWVLAEMEHGTSPVEWDEMLAPLALFADAARVLPPQTWQVVEPEYSTREMGEPVDVEVDVDKHEEPAPRVQRPEEPLELPTRATGAVRGVMDHRAIGGDEVEAIADGPRREDPETDLTRVRRDQTPPSIFGD